MLVPKELDKWVVWKLSALDSSETHAYTESQLLEDVRYDLGKNLTRGLKKVLRDLARQRRIVKVGDRFQLPNRSVQMTLLKTGRRVDMRNVKPLELTAETREMQSRMRKSARAAWIADPGAFWVQQGLVVRKGTRADVQSGLLPISLGG